MAKEYLVEGAMCTCTLGTAPGKFKVTDNDFLTMNGKYTGTINTLGNCFEPPGFGSCNQNPMMPKPCNPSVVQWLDFYDGLKINGSYALLMNSKATCAMGVPNCISFIQSGQIAIPSASQKTQEVAANEQEMNPMAPIEEDQQEVTIKEAYWIDDEGNRQQDLPIEKEITLYVKVSTPQSGDNVDLQFNFDKDKYEPCNASGTIGEDYIIVLQNFKVKLKK